MKARWFIVLALVFPSLASAHHHRGHRAQRLSPIAVALKDAHELWGVEPCGGHYEVWATQLAPELGGHANWNSPTGENYESPPSTFTNCVLEIRADDWHDPEQVAFGWAELCTIVMHEYGHLTGHPHSDEDVRQPAETQEQREVMRSGLTDTSPDLKRCGWKP